MVCLIAKEFELHDEAYHIIYSYMYIFTYIYDYISQIPLLISLVAILQRAMFYIFEKNLIIAYHLKKKIVRVNILGLWTHKLNSKNIIFYKTDDPWVRIKNEQTEMLCFCFLSLALALFEGPINYFDKSWKNKKKKRKRSNFVYYAATFHLKSIYPITPFYIFFTMRFYRGKLMEENHNFVKEHRKKWKIIIIIIIP